MEEQIVDGIFGLDPDGGDELTTTSRTGLDPTSSSGLTDVPTNRRDDGSDPRTSLPQTDNPMLEPNASEATSLLGDPRSAHRGSDDPMSLLMTDVPGQASRGAGDLASSGTNDPVRGADVEEDPMSSIHWSDDDPTPSRLHTGDPMRMIQRGVMPMGMIPLNDEKPELPSGTAFASCSSSSSGSRASSDESDDEDMFVEVEQTKKAKRVKKKAKVKINPRGIRHLLGIYVLSREYGVVISTEHLSYLTDFRVRGRSEELKHTVTNSSGMAFIAGFPSKDDHFEDRFFYVEISERTVEADCIDLIKKRWERRVKSSLPEVSKEFVTVMHSELSSGNGNWRKSFIRRRIERSFSAEIFPGKILGRGQARVSLREQAALEAAAKAKRSSGSSTPRVAAPMTSPLTAPLVRARPSRPSASKTLLPPPFSGELSLFFDRLVSNYDEDVRSRDNELGAAKEANAVLQSSLDETVERNEALERDALALQKVKKNYDDKLANLKLRCPKTEGEVVQLRGELSSASDLQRSRTDDAVAEARDEMARSFAE
ncbi:hypothetical protein AALP_AAs58988U000100 [Arabis alpina]|uniref:Uncharacterized protein n=1 Tax=Arabis alpina TaxID=50452 RepID=A0A087FY71_ARAAL|nr:hypothetical protein AALP_AAs58988U000100 [Arabis alpina]